MPPIKSVNYINSRFTQEMFRDSINVPIKLLREHEHLGLSERELFVLLRLLYLYYSKDSLNIEDMAAEFALSVEEAAALAGPLVAKEILLPADEEEQGRYSLDGLFAQLYELWTIEKRHASKTKARPKAEAQKRRIAELAQLYRLFERELGRNLSPIENDKISQWLEQEQQSPELILEALRRAVLQGKPNFAYIDRILFNWRRQNLRTPEEVAQHDEPPAKKPPQAKKPAAERVKDTWLEA